MPIYRRNVTGSGFWRHSADISALDERDVRPGARLVRTDRRCIGETQRGKPLRRHSGDTSPVVAERWVEKGRAAASVTQKSDVRASVGVNIVIVQATTPESSRSRVSETVKLDSFACAPPTIA